MKRHVPAKLPALWGMLCALGPSAALAAERACPAANVVSDEALRDRWPDLVPRVRDEVLRRHDIDACASIMLRLAADTSIRVEVALPDGRAASRAGLRPEDVIPMLQALLLIPDRSLDPVVPVPPRTPATGSTNERSRARPRAAAHVAAEGPDASASSPAGRAGGVGVELSVIGGARFGDGQASYALGAESFLDVSGWLVGFEGRADRYHPLSVSGAESQTALELGALAGKRIHFEGVTLDVAAGPAFAIKGALSSETDVAVVNVNSPETLPPEPPPPLEQSSGAVPRLLASVRLGMSPRSVLRAFVGVDGTFGPARADGLGPNSPGMPRWTLGLTLGATVGTP